MENRVMAFTEVGNIETMPASMPKVGPKDVLVHIKATCLCTQEQRIYRGIKSPMGWPVVGGHESAGIVVAVGDEVTKVAVGDHVAIAGGVTPASGRQVFTEHGPANEDGFYRFLFSTMCRYYATSEEDVVVSQRKADFKYLALTEPVSDVLASVNRANVEIGQTAVVIGAGIMGLLHVQFLKMRGAQIIVSEINPERIEKAKKFGADFVINPKECDVVEEVFKITEGIGADVVFNATAIPENWPTAIDMTAEHGKVIGYSSQHPDTPVPVQMGKLHNRCTQIIGTIGSSPQEQYIACKLIERGALELDEIMDQEYDFEDCKAALERAIVPGVYRVVITDNLIEP